MSDRKDDNGKKENFVKGFLRKTFNTLQRWSISLREGSLDKALIAATRHGWDLRVSFLISTGANPKAKNNAPLKYAVEYAHMGVLRVLLKNGVSPNEENGVALQIAITHGQRDVAKYLLQQGADIHAKQDEAIIIAAGMRNTRMMELLIDSKADVNARGGEPAARRRPQRQRIRGAPADTRRRRCARE